ncbi:uncharacterized protein LOC143246149 [Tachypleus tridentatus]|uniref:uncharacterized protein LOC143246149 n=1 Tax=Tachypleus tridentatus TaxID=6853 RepID=UPI003FD06AE5
MKFGKLTIVFLLAVVWFSLPSYGLKSTKNKYQHAHQETLENEADLLVLHQPFNVLPFSDYFGPKTTVDQAHSNRPRSMVKKALSLLTNWHRFLESDDDGKDSFAPVASRGHFKRPIGHPLRWG